MTHASPAKAIAQVQLDLVRAPGCRPSPIPGSELAGGQSIKHEHG